ncbi:guanine nucleotide-binding protein subunit gamma 3-like [Rhododendron vialii]|uniref:guanine nucleotide-binding protein subunit gamma 3-like n=1 Tax=Rhododendron vialii TaxID=182163 RepID=UPI00265DE62F|nr:guanine nucleotide-binding protein subunit gamma 3-like [Rhododendron vialii]
MAVSGGSSSVPSLPPPRPPEYPALYGKRRELAKVQMLEREISFLEEELKFVHGLQPASRSCKEVADFVVANSDPLITSNRKIQRSCRFWKWLCRATCLNFSWICCVGCIPRRERPRCCSCNLRGCCLCFSCLVPKRGCCPCPRSRCLDSFSCSSSCCFPRCPSCPDCSCRCRCSCPNCLKANPCFCCTKNCFRCMENCCYPCCLCS